MAAPLDMGALSAYLSTAYPDWHIEPKAGAAADYQVRLHFEYPSLNPAYTLRQDIIVGLHPDDVTPEQVVRTTLHYQVVCLRLLIRELLMRGQFPDEVT